MRGCACRPLRPVGADPRGARPGQGPAQDRCPGRRRTANTPNQAAAGQDAAGQPSAAATHGRKIAAQPLAPAPQASQLTVPGEAAFESARSLAAAAGSIAELRAALDGFTGCNLRHSAKSLVFADGNPDADIMFIGEAPDREEDIQGAPFVGRPGQLLDRMLAAIGLNRDTVYVTTMIPWRPPGNRTPAAHEIELCRPFIERHVALAAPKIVVMLGNVASRSLLGTKEGILSVRGTWMDYKANDSTIPALPTLHPGYLLKYPAQKQLAWMDLLSLQARIEQLKAG
ncbi:uracil-DNA glycosylase [Hoeflea ulvae]|uniref:Type-4 uracil-DNA glycosylase n=1 Tax=Hoeflea ulvae TaxID=2983764 RepID=A0ABT3YF20_9HYPH|nr:uracil-DNA glycosylase [Hoeflea ulvae]MCY0094474.1 uracil-DNA glycosylase [Hoeflea ulvae]